MINEPWVSWPILPLNSFVLKHELHNIYIVQVLSKIFDDGNKENK
mgnify:FL=1